MHPAARLSVVARTRTRFQFRCGTISPQHVVEEVETPHARSPPWLPTTIPYIVSLSRGNFRLPTWHYFSPSSCFQVIACNHPPVHPLAFCCSPWGAVGLPSSARTRKET
ncbi:conserved hypothetical protein, unlikely [Trypanosoma brucei gambiense DAL972]|uniref:Uncharacterized protein n=1 Tax=Trypanosoma brucei gambiense (strain MHOM/CI/86/DAL972) TaxID=679716 RepID=D0A0D9_TRYB9|nr:conserved hypothetical protein, unlikely [Trypanosoma brucei gambiense DAL972]CBH16697.1 conserved hypothetical protein, unlikely [Trypanosoma brucei gambiense DAL972]|eukprot:XP_011778961.1 conserved hypothetical protein, unlikely [Trypanosoma brucei gambiense DAL972]